ncbi:MULTISPECIES: MotA/TolQ/ExbB proton channel family protein [Nitrosomonas]|uniref:Biopolymer transport protein ExbB n=1 Tax=Nitrosomonas oligotropha TaxID=42354 RepID=A0A1H8QTX7_9PROT|nr:MotA/TolQ/ExbB proton channel family protein [Nitrosomonas oligotropha]MBX9916573.1 MotA/TolQ/ExbB proton channel family protein [Nitrosomonas sp.]OQW85524.1 MAG: flagellar motor protein MotA [Proteobacteria bacterium ST_bin16]TXI37394.1 MAG: MotA/TolQ/ExbB proton channel family protein [Nitrosomonas sp.]SDW88586.1 biopolymer transport protein ExbB [Nitrosomonas oligotropha]SEO57263.1 biopolymer transport protein ExbB [Nitrosomonas oligotropha]
MLSLIQAAGWPIWPIIIASVVALGIIGERMWTLRLRVVSPKELLPRVLNEYKRNGVNAEMLARLQQHSPLGQILAAGLKNVKSTREVMKESIEESGRVIAHDLNRYLTTLGTIAALSPLMGLFGTLVGMIEIFGSNSPTGSNPAQLAYGISVALYNAAFGILVAIPSMIFYRHFRAKVDDIVIEMELQALKLVEMVHGERES